MAATEQVILVNEMDQIQGSAEKLEAHRQGWCHRAFSVFIYRLREEREFLLQQRAKNKYHSPNLWTNTCCSHPRPGENTQTGAERRLFEEMGLRIPLRPLGYFHYVAHFENGLTENEVDHVFIGELTSELIQPDSEEAQAYQWLTLQALEKAIKEKPANFTPWLIKVMRLVKSNTNDYP